MADYAVSAVQLTPAQQAVLKADILADPVLAGWAATGAMAQEIAEAYNAAATPAWYVWRTAVTADEWRDAILNGGGAAQLDNLTVSKRDSLLWACSGVLDTSKSQVRDALKNFCGSQNQLKAALAAIQKRTATRAEKLFSTGTGSAGSPATMTFSGSINYQDVEAALALP